MPVLLNILRLWFSGLKRMQLHARIRTRYPQASLDPRIAWQIDNMDALVIGAGCNIGPFSEIVVANRSSFSGVAGRLVIGRRCVIGAFANVRAAGGEIHLGDNCLLAQNVTIVAANHQCVAGSTYRDAPWDDRRTGVTLGDNCWVGAGAVILPGVRIGANAVIGAGSVVTRDVPADEIWARVPAIKLGEVAPAKEQSPKS